MSVPMTRPVSTKNVSVPVCMATLDVDRMPSVTTKTIVLSVHVLLVLKATPSYHVFVAFVNTMKIVLITKRVTV